jgi:hypothetical protein
MTTENSESLIQIPESSLEDSISNFNQPLAHFLEELGLPIENVLYPLAERKIIVNALKDALSILPIDERTKSHYLTKFTVAIAVGLFDGAINYLWNETIRAIRQMIQNFDLSYFFFVAENINSRHKNLSSSDDLLLIGDHDLLEACRRIGLISDVNYKRFENINYMRNHISAAHPNDEQIDGFEILAWLRVCLRHAITAEPDHSVVSIKRLLGNIRTEVIPIDDFLIIGQDLEKQSQERLDDLLWTLFGMFIDPRLPLDAKTNITNLAKFVWDASSEDRKYEIGARYGTFRKNAEVAKKDSAQEFLEIVNGISYKDEDSLAGELIEKLETLKRVHYEVNNFYNEYSHAKSLKSSLPPTGNVPRAARHLWVKTICICFVGNGLGYREGVDESALPFYNEFLDNFSEAEITEFIYLVGDTEFTAVLDWTKTDKRIRLLSRKLRAITKNSQTQRALDLIVNAPEKKWDNFKDSTDFKRVLITIPKSR